MFNVPLLVWVGYIAVAVIVWAMLLIFREKREGERIIVREEGETKIPVFTFDDKGGDDVYTGPTELAIEVRRCKKCGKKIRNDRWFCSMKCKRAYLRRRK